MVGVHVNIHQVGRRKELNLLSRVVAYLTTPMLVDITHLDPSPEATKQVLSTKAGTAPDSKMVRVPTMDSDGGRASAQPRKASRGGALAAVCGLGSKQLPTRYLGLRPRSTAMLLSEPTLCPTLCEATSW